ncbi:hypothetical protein J8273_7235 [Carpediemonas membranifera]|uniref:Uncharacterized protein n=1 Tax=Carpediemonas membranifera TaxID=201153 RepID=A0A8J6B1E2_9EUKA|nr:hypothetical protein J8273_7235 [Carpediemonas membranifera]|eukprot:KAG9390962.1 hypothetical protein J8273_7235 [Carpediemonas membranifera]
MPPSETKKSPSPIIVHDRTQSEIIKPRVELNPTFQYSTSPSRPAPPPPVVRTPVRPVPAPSSLRPTDPVEVFVSTPVPTPMVASTYSLTVDTLSPRLETTHTEVPRHSNETKDIAVGPDKNIPVPFDVTLCDAAAPGPAVRMRSLGGLALQEQPQGMETVPFLQLRTLEALPALPELDLTELPERERVMMQPPSPRVGVEEEDDESVSLEIDEGGAESEQSLVVDPVIRDVIDSPPAPLRASPPTPEPAGLADCPVVEGIVSRERSPAPLQPTLPLSRVSTPKIPRGHAKTAPVVPDFLMGPVTVTAADGTWTPRADAVHIAAEPVDERAELSPVVPVPFGQRAGLHVETVPAGPPDPEPEPDAPATPSPHDALDETIRMFTARNLLGHDEPIRPAGSPHPLTTRTPARGAMREPAFFEDPYALLSTQQPIAETSPKVLRTETPAPPTRQQQVRQSKDYLDEILGSFLNDLIRPARPM